MTLWIFLIFYQDPEMNCSFGEEGLFYLTKLKEKKNYPVPINHQAQPKKSVMV